jgi:hypothetical protein
MAAAAVDLGFPGPVSASWRAIRGESGRRRPDWAAGGGGRIGRGGERIELGSRGRGRGLGRRTRGGKNSTLFFSIWAFFPFDLVSCVCVCGDGGLELLLTTSADGDGSNYLLGYLKGEQ